MLEKREDKLQDRLRMSKDELLLRIEEAKGPKSKEILRKGIQYESFGHIYYAVLKCPIVYATGSGTVVKDVDGNEYIDLISGWSTQNVGNCHPRIVETIRTQAGKLLTNAEMPCEARAELAERLVKITPGGTSKKVHFLTTGSEAVELAIRLAKWHTGRGDILPFTGGYHGRTYAALSLSGNAYFRIFDLTVQQAYRLPYAYCYRCFFGKEYPECAMQCVRYIEMLFESGQCGLRDPKSGVTTVAGIIVEPMQSHAGYIIPPNEFLQGLRNICDKYGVLLIDDEIQTGWGRTGKMWGIEHSKVIPDLMTVGKSIAGGIPMSATIAKAEIFDSLGVAGYGTTFGGTPLACAVGLTVIDVFEEEELVERSEKMGEYFLKGLRDLQADHALIGHVDGRGLYIGMEFVKDRGTKEPAREETERIQYEAFKRGLLIEKSGYYGNRLNLIPPLIITKEQIDSALERLGEAIKAVK